MDLETIKELSGPEYIFLSGNIVNDAFLEAKLYENQKWKECFLNQHNMWVNRK